MLQEVGMSQEQTGVLDAVTINDKYCTNNMYGFSTELIEQDPLRVDHQCHHVFRLTTEKFIHLTSSEQPF